MTMLYLLAASAATEIPAQVITTIVAFLLVIGVLYIFAFKPAMATYEARAKEMSDKFDDIDAKTTESEKKLNEYEEKLRQIDEEARERQNKAIDEGRKMAEDLIAEAKAEAEAITNKAKEQMSMEIDKARVELRREAVEMTLAATGKLLSAELNDDKHRQLVESFMQDMDTKSA